MSDPPDGMETLLVGIDAACPGVVEPLVADGQLPHLESVMETGANDRLESQIPPWTASAWPSIYTGTNPGKHGMYGFLKYDGYDWDVVDFTDLRELTLWEILSQHEKASVVVNAPVTHPAKAFDGAIIPGYVAPEDPETHPPDLLTEVTDAIGDYRVYPDPDRDPAEEHPALVRMRGDAFCYLAEEIDPAFGFVQFQVTDSIFHEHPDDTDLVGTVYRAVDEQLGRLTERFDPETVIVASDHGMGPYEEYEFRVNEFLRDGEWLETTVGDSGMPAWLPILNDRLREGEDHSRTGEASVAARAISAASRVGLTPERAGKLLRALGLHEAVSGRLPTDAKRAGREQVDFPASTAYMRSRIELGIRLNVAGRDPDGVVPPEEYDGVRNALIDELAAVRTPDGDPVFETVAAREEFYWGPYVEDAVDIVTVPHEFEQFLSADLKGEQFGPPTEPWNHKLDGLVAVSGTAVDPTADLSGAHLFDVAPTVLASMGIPASDRMDGEVLPALPESGRESYRPPDRQPEGRETDPAVEDRLEAIGYI